MAAPVSLRERLAQLWPESDVSASERPPGPGFRRFSVIDRRGVLLIVPLADRRTAAEAMTRWSDADSAADVVLRVAGRTLARIGMSAALPGSSIWVRARSARGEPETLHEYLATALGQRYVEISCTFGPSRPNQKPIVRVHSDEGSTIGFTKVGWNDITRELIEDEAAFLAMPSVRSTRTFVVPSVIHRGTWQGRTMVITSPLRGRPRIRRADPSIDVMMEIAHLTRPHNALFGESIYRVELEDRLRGIRPSATATARDALHRFDSLWAHLGFDFGRWHGDWTPWNMNQGRRGALVWDWERTAAPRPVGFDLLHHEFQRRIGTDPNEVVASFDRAIAFSTTLLRPTGIPDGSVAALGCLYVFEMHLRFHDRRLEGRSPAWIEGLLAHLLARGPAVASTASDERSRLFGVRRRS